MLDNETILKALPIALHQFEIPGDLPRGKVRDYYILEDGKRRVLITTDRLSVFGEFLGLVPYKGQILNQLSAWWFERTEDIIPNHFISMPDPNVTVAQETRPVQLEVVVRGYITGITPTSLWTRYASGEREIYGKRFPDGLRKNDPLPQPVVTPTTKSTIGREDRAIVNDVVKRQFLDAQTWQRVQDIALALYQRGQNIASQCGLILVDTKYEFGINEDTGELVLIDELHTPDSSRYWDGTTYQQRIRAGLEPDNLDKEAVRLWYVSQQDKTSKVPQINGDLIVLTSQRYQRVYERLVSEPFVPAEYPAQDRIQAALDTLR